MDEHTLELITAFAQLDPNPQITSVMMEFVEIPKPLVRYQAGPVIIHQSAWAETLPGWIIPAVYADRAELIEQEVKAGIVGELATLTEVLAYMYPATMDAPLAYEWVQIYLYAGQAALTKHNKIPDGKTFAQVVTGKDELLELDDYIRTQFLIPLQRNIRSRVVRVATEKGVAKQSRVKQGLSQPPTGSTEVDRHIEDEPSPTVTQMSLFDLES